MANKDTKYVFRLQSETKGQHDLQNSLKHWDESRMYDDKQINAIESSNEKSENQPTSIPSPFARIALVKTAFAEVAAYGDRALHAYKKIVSDSLDVAEIFFTYAKWQNKIEIVKWDKDTDLPKLQAGHKILYKTLKTFLESDAVAYNFDKMKCIYILKYKPTGEMIGATSPCTLFFSSANEFNKANEKGEIKNPIDILLSNNHKAYSGIMPLHKRSWEFQKYLYTWVAANNETHVVNDKAEWIFKDFYNYLQAQKDLQPEKVQEIDNIFEHEKLAMENLKNNYNPIAGYEILSKSIYEQKIDENKIIVSDFKVKTTLKNELLPLILPLKGGNGSGYENWSLTETTKWASFIANEKADRNILPDGTRYGWLTRNDFLEDKIICFPYSIQEESFFSGNLKNSTNTYLLPLKEKYFEYFSTEDLKKHITINGGDSTVKITLKIPVHNGEVIFEKEYKESEMTLVKKRDFDCAIFPNVKFENDKLAFYRIGLFSPFSEKDVEYSADFYKGSTRIALNENDWIKRNTSDNENSVCTIYSLNQKTFDHIRIKIDNVNGVLIPLLPKIENTDSFTFAVDFGTTNTHIEYKTSSNHKIRPLDIQSATGEHQIQFLHGKTEAHTLVSDIDFIPKEIGTDTKFKFPVRTALSLSKNRNKSKTISSFVHANIVIPYEKKQIPKYNEVLTQLKWDATEEEMGYFIDSLCFILRNKTILNKGVLDSTKIVWFYPLSMAGTRSKIIAEKWKLAYAKYFLGISVCNIDDLEENIKDILKENIKDLPESVAPFLYYKDDPKYKDAINNLVSIDIGGGTTDVVFVKDKKVEYVTSFRFAANSIFGIGEHITPVVSKYQSEIEGIIEANDPHFNLTNILNSIKASKFGDLASFFFSLSNNEDLKNVEINFNSMLKKDKEQKLVFVLFYASIIYHTAQIMKARELPLPRHITFSGNGSKIVNIVADKDVLAEFSKLIFEKVYDQKYGNSGLDIIQNTVNPKEVTCKGGIKAADKDYVQTLFVPVVLMGTDSTTFASDNDTYSSIDLDKCVSNTNTEVKAFINYVIDDLLMQKYTKGGVVEETFLTALNLNQNTLQVAKDVCEKEEDFVTFTKNGIMGKIESVTDTSSTKIEETFFFYPIACLLNTISTEINKKN